MGTRALRLSMQAMPILDFTGPIAIYIHAFSLTTKTKLLNLRKSSTTVTGMSMTRTQIVQSAALWVLTRKGVSVPAELFYVRSKRS